MGSYGEPPSEAKPLYSSRSLLKPASEVLVNNWASQTWISLTRNDQVGLQKGVDPFTSFQVMRAENMIPHYSLVTFNNDLARKGGLQHEVLSY